MNGKTTNPKQKYFIFIDETGNNTQDKYFGLGCLIIPTNKIGEYHERLKIKYGQIHTQVKNHEINLEKNLKNEDLINFLKGRKGMYEMKFQNINKNTENQYKWLISEYFKFEDAKFCGLIIDKDKYPNPKEMSHFDAYINQLVMLVKSNIKDESFVLIPDDITVPKGKEYESFAMDRFLKNNKKCFGIHRIESHSSLFIQMADVLIGSIIYEFQKGKKLPKQAISQKVLEKLKIQTFQKSFTKNIPNYFSVWIYKK